MIVEAQVTIDGSKQAVWAVITGIENASETIGAIEEVEVLEKPADGLVGLKWRETRTLFRKTATEVMWVTDAAENEFYRTRAESHGCVYLSTVRVSERDDGCALTMTHESKPQSFMAKMLALPMGAVFKGAMKKTLMQDLNDIKMAVERQPGGRSS